MNWQPLNDRVLIERLEEAPKGIIITDSDKSTLGRVVAVGPGKWVEGVNGGMVRARLDVKPGDLVRFNSKWSDMGDDYQHQPWWWQDNLHLVQEGDIFGKVNA